MRCVVVGTGHAGALHAAAVHAATDADLVAVASSSVGSARDLGAPEVAVESLVDIDLAIVATPPTVRLDLIRQLVPRCTFVLVETPLALTAADAMTITEVSSRIVPATNLVHAPVVGALKRLRGDESPTHVEVNHARPMPTWGGYRDQRWGAGVLYELGAPALQLALMLIESPVATVEASITRRGGVDVAARLRLSLSDGTGATVTVSWVEPVDRLDLQVATPTSVVRAELVPGLLLEHNGDRVAPPVEPASRRVDPRLHRFGYIGQVSAAAAWVRGDRPVPPSDTAVTTLELCTAAALSSATGSAVALADLTQRALTPAAVQDAHNQGPEREGSERPG